MVFPTSAAEFSKIMSKSKKNYSSFGFDYKYRIYNNQDCVLGMETRKRYRPSDMDNMLNVNKATNGENKLRVK